MKKKIILVILVLLVLLSGGYYLINKDKPLTEEKYLKKYSTNLSLDDVNDFSGLELINEDLKDKEIILTNETHGAKENSFLNWKFLMYLVKNHGVNYFIMESGYADGVILNEYLSTGDEKLLTEFFSSWSSLCSSKETYEMFRKLYEYNKAVSEEKKIKIIAVDVDYGYVQSSAYLKRVIDKLENLPQELNHIKEKLNTLDEASIKIYRKEKESEQLKTIVDITSAIEEDMLKNKGIYESVLKDKFFDFSFVIRNMKNATKVPKYRFDPIGHYNTRDKLMYENFKTLYEHFPKGKYYGHFGTHHAFQEETGGIKFFASHLNKDDQFKNKIYSINTLYTEGVIARGGGIGLEKRQFKSVSSELNKKLESTYGDYKVKLINLEKRKSPFQSKLDLKYFEEYDVWEKQGVLTDYFQSVIIINKPTPQNPYVEELMTN